MQLGLVVLGIVLAIAEGLSELNASLIEEKSANTRFLVEIAHSNIKSFHDQQLAGQLSEAQAQEAAKNAVAQLRYDDGNYFWIQDMQPAMIMHPLKPQLNGKDLSNNADPNGKRLFVEMVNVVKKNGEGRVPYLWPLPGQDEPAEKISYVKQFQPWGWIIGSGVYLVDVDEAYWQAAVTQLSLGALTVVIVGIMALLLSRSISVPLGKTSHALNNIASGDGDLTQRLDEEGDDELSATAKSFNAFVSKIESAMIEVRTASEQLNSASVNLGTSMSKNKSTMHKQQQESHAAATAITEMASTVNEIAKSAENAACSATEANREADNGQSVVGEATNAVSTLATEVKQAAAVINSLNADTQSISSVLDTIRGIAEQTNLLALNAAIEAARAGEQGRGFAVVADEVRTLAARTQTSTEEIRQMIESLQHGSQEAVKAMESGEKSTELTVEKATAAGRSLSSIVQSITSISDMNMHIASAAEEQSAAANEIDRSINLMADLTSQSYSDIEESSASVEELALLSNTLRKLLDQFKLGTR